MHTIPVALTVAGSDPSGGAGLQADLKTFHQLGVYGASVVSLLTVQNTRAVTAVEFVTPAFLRAQLDAVVSDLAPRAAKTGALGRAELLRAFATHARETSFPWVIDPVMVSKHGASLLDDDAVTALREDVLPLAFVVTPNLHEAARLAGFGVTDPETMERAARRIADMGARHVVVKGGHLAREAHDLLWSEGRATAFAAPRVESVHTHGTGCTLSAAITARLAQGASVLDAVRDARGFVREAIATAPGLGGGCGPVNHFASRPAAR